MLTLLRAALEISLLSLGMPSAMDESEWQLTGCDEATLRTPGLIAVEVAPGTGPYASPGHVVELRWSHNGRGTDRWGIPFRIKVGDDPFWSAVLHRIRVGESRRVRWENTAFESNELEIELVRIEAVARVKVYG